MKLSKLRPVSATITAPAIVPVTRIAESTQVSYMIGAVVALFILGYLVYSLLKPDKF